MVRPKQQSRSGGASGTAWHPDGGDQKGMQPSSKFLTNCLTFQTRDAIWQTGRRKIARRQTEAADLPTRESQRGVSWSSPRLFKAVLFCSAGGAPPDAESRGFSRCEEFWNITGDKIIWGCFAARRSVADSLSALIASVRRRRRESIQNETAFYTFAVLEGIDQRGENLKSFKVDWHDKKPPIPLLFLSWGAGCWLGKEFYKDRMVSPRC